MPPVPMPLRPMPSLLQGSPSPDLLRKGSHRGSRTALQSQSPAGLFLIGPIRVCQKAGYLDARASS